MDPATDSSNQQFIVGETPISPAVIMEACHNKAREIREPIISYLLIDADRHEISSGFVGIDLCRGLARAKAIGIISVGSDREAWNPADKYGPGLSTAYIMCCCCDPGMMFSASCCSRRFNVLGGLAIDVGGGRVGALAVSGSLDCRKDVEIAAAGLQAAGLVETDAPQGGKIWKLLSPPPTSPPPDNTI